MTVVQLALPVLHLFLTLLVNPTGPKLSELIACLQIEGGSLSCPRTREFD